MNFFCHQKFHHIALGTNSSTFVLIWNFSLPGGNLEFNKNRKKHISGKITRGTPN